jgi:serine/threonine protein kinase
MVLRMALEPVAGAIFGERYRLVRRLASGAMGVVYEARHIATDRRCALKVMLAHIAPRPELRKRFELEARVTAHIDSPFIVELFDAGVDDATGMPFLVMELLRGEELGQCLRRVGRFSAEETLACLHQTALALDRTHRASIVHRDLKPANLFLSVGEDGERRIKILDFGVAKIVAESTGETTTGMGTPLYMAPEQFRNQRVSVATDIHALGMMAYTLLVGEAYWADEKKENDDLVAFALSAAYGPVEPASERAMRKGVVLPAGFDAWFARATAVEPSRRFSGATAAVRALGDALGIVDLAALALPRPDLGPAETSLPREATATPERRNTTGDGGTRADPGTLTRTDTGLAKSESEGFQPDEVDSEGTKAAKTRAGEARSDEPKPGKMAPRRRRTWSILLLALTGGLPLAAVGAWRIERHKPPSIAPPAVSPLRPVSSVLACPPLEASGVDAPAGWLGAAAATVVCERARLILGGASERTLVPAELLGLPRGPVDRFPIDPYGQADARVRSLESARRRAEAYVDGEVVKGASGFRVSLVLRRPDGGELGRGLGAGRGLYQAVGEAMNPLIGPAWIPRAAALDPTMADFSRARDIDGALVLLDLALAMSNNAGELPYECLRVGTKSDELAELGPVERRHCAYTLGLPLPEVVLPRGDAASPGGLAARARADHVIRRVDDPAVIAELERLFEREPTAVGRSTLATTLSCLLESSDPKRAKDMALLAVAAEPQNSIGEGCAPWLQLIAVTQGTASTEAALRAVQAWVPWNSYGWLYQARSRADQDDALVYARRAYALSPLDTLVAGTLAGQLLASGAREEARSIALMLATGGYSVHRVGSELLLVRIEASEARFGAALSRAKKSMVVATNEVGWLRAQRFEIAWYALQLALILGRAQEIADLVVERFLDPEPPLLDGAPIEVPLRLPAVCAHASPAVSRRCFTRFRELRQRLSYSLLPDADTFIAGAERYAKGDFDGAARAFRPLLRTPGPFVEVLAEPMVETFEHTGERELVDRVEAAIVDRAAEQNGASLAQVRAARRAAKRGDAARAQALAEQVIQAWSVADEPVPAVAEMRRLVQAPGAPAR